MFEWTLNLPIVVIRSWMMFGLGCAMGLFLHFIPLLYAVENSWAEITQIAYPVAFPESRAWDYNRH
jgi:hypothetical protein